MKLYPSSKIVKEVGFATVRAMYLYLQREGVLKKIPGRWMLSREHAGLDLVRYQYKRGWKLYWTTRGLDYLKDLMNGQGRMETKKASA